MPIAAATDKSQPTTVAIDVELPAHSEEDMEETEHRECRSMGNQHLTLLTLYSASPIELPDVDMFWQPEYSTKVPVSFVCFWR